MESIIHELYIFVCMDLTLFFLFLFLSSSLSLSLSLSLSIYLSIYLSLSHPPASIPLAILTFMTNHSP